MSEVDAEHFSAETGQGSSKGLYLRERDLYLRPANGLCGAPGRALVPGLRGLFCEGRRAQVVSGGRGDSPELWEHLNNPLIPLSLPLFQTCNHVSVVERDVVLMDLR